MKTTMIRFVKEHVWGPTGSVVFHALILMILMAMVIEPPAPPPSATFILDVVPPTDIPFDPVPIDQPYQDPNDVPAEVLRVAIPEVPTGYEPPMVDAPPLHPTFDPSDTGIAIYDGPVIMPGLYAGRFGADRDRALAAFNKKYGFETEAAVLRALDWLREHQYADGSWGPHYRVSMTGLALLSFLAHGETTGSPEYGESIRRGLRYLLSRQADSGWILGGGPHVPAPQLRVYEHVIAVYALAEAYSLTKIPMLKPGLEDAVQVILDGQMENGGWAYDFAREGPPHIDVSLGGWVIQALKAAQLAHVDNRGLVMAIENGVRAIRSMTDPTGGGLFAYSTRVPTHPPDTAMTGVGVLLLQLTGYINAEEARIGLQALSSLKFGWQRDPGDRGIDHRQPFGDWPLYAWYYITQARFQHNPDSWEAWNQRFAPGMARRQNPDGSWCPPPGSVEARYGPVYATTLPALMLQVYYRLLPTYKPVPLDDALTQLDTGQADDFSIRFE